MWEVVNILGCSQYIMCSVHVTLHNISIRPRIIANTNFPWSLQKRTLQLCAVAEQCPKLDLIFKIYIDTLLYIFMNRLACAAAYWHCQLVPLFRYLLQPPYKHASPNLFTTGEVKKLLPEMIYLPARQNMGCA
ncbi:hypothetical protein GDO78_007275 [Eleutherodactylus coqui]|uniref:Uncharacterized protein n=1 Tax=Eleutherodactylus coqui TaxID=57060 RepID=A0A8J6KD53_ELECQ|nr:hypothetical protein GDO78_007275 [Eleutherodactylus coqui]